MPETGMPGDQKKEQEGWLRFAGLCLKIWDIFVSRYNSYCGLGTFQ